MPPMASGLFITCLADTLSPEVGQATVRLLERLGRRGRVPARADVLRPDALQRGLPGRGDRARGDASSRVFDGYDAVVDAVGVVCRARAEHVPACSWRTTAACRRARGSSPSSSSSVLGGRRRRLGVSRARSPTTRPATRCGCSGSATPAVAPAARGARRRARRAAGRRGVLRLRRHVRRQERGRLDGDARREAATASLASGADAVCACDARA